MSKKVLGPVVVALLLFSPLVWADDGQGIPPRLAQILTFFGIDSGCLIDPNGCSETKGGSTIDPNGLAAVGDEGPGLDPNGFEVEGRAVIDPNGLTTDKGMGLDPNG